MPAVSALLPPQRGPVPRQDPGLARQRGQALLAAAQGAPHKLQSFGKLVEIPKTLSSYKPVNEAILLSLSKKGI